MSVLALKIRDFFNIRSLHATVSTLPKVLSGLRYTGLPADNFNALAGCNRINHGDDLVISKIDYA